MRDELDLPPEFCQYRDEGCELSDSCLECHLPECIYDTIGEIKRLRKEARDKEMVRLFNTRSKGVKELARIFGVSERTVQRALKTIVILRERQRPKNPS